MNIFIYKKLQNAKLRIYKYFSSKVVQKMRQGDQTSFFFQKKVLCEVKVNDQNFIFNIFW